MKFIYKMSSMMIMFIPIKIFIVIASENSIGFLDSYQNLFSFDLTLVFLFSLLAAVYLVNLFSQYLIPKIVSLQKSKFKGSEIKYMGTIYPRGFVRKCYGHVLNFLSDFFLVIVSFLVSSYISFDFSVIYISVIFLFYMLIEYLALTENRFNFLGSIGLEVSDFISICSSFNFLVLFSCVFWVYYVSGMEIHDGVLLMMISRLANSGVKGIALSNYKISQHFKQMNSK